MPHVQIRGLISLPPLVTTLSQVLESKPPLVLKVAEAYLGEAGEKILLEVVVVEGHLRQNFFILIRAEADALVIRCHPAMHVQKTEGVKQMIALIARKTLAEIPGGSVGNTNLEPYLTD